MKWTDEKIQKMVKSNYGSGTGQEYKPWIHIKDVPSEGTSQRPLGWKTERVHQLLSQLELEAFLAFDWADEIIDIREQYPLDRNKTIAIADELSIKHPIYIGTNVNVVMTTDFLLTVKTEQGMKLVARSIKPFSKFSDLRTLEKLEIERTLWKREDIDWGIITDKDVAKIFTNNLLWLHKYKDPTGIDLREETFISLVKHLMSNISNTKETFLVCFDHFDYTFNLSKGTAISLFRYILANKLFKVKDMFSTIDLNKSVPDILEIRRCNN